MRTTSLIALLSIPAIGLLSLASAVEVDGKAGRTGAPGEMTCREGCHNSFPLNSGGGSVVLNAPTMSNWEYVPGTTYPLSVTVSKSGVGLFGFALGALAADGSNAGALVVTDPVRTHIKTAFVGGEERFNMTHRTMAGAGVGTVTFDFEWTAPNTNSGPVSFHFAGNAANQDWTNSGDYIYTGYQAVAPASTVSITDVVWETSSREPWVTPDDGGRILLHLNCEQPGMVTADLLDAQGRRMSRVMQEELPAGMQQKHLHALAELRSGTYFLHVQVDGRAHLVRFVHLTR